MSQVEEFFFPKNGKEFFENIGNLWQSISFVILCHQVVKISPPEKSL
jgi:hypothetical protein